MLLQAYGRFFQLVFVIFIFRIIMNNNKPE